MTNRGNRLNRADRFDRLNGPDCFNWFDRANLLNRRRFFSKMPCHVDCLSIPVELYALPHLLQKGSILNWAGKTRHHISEDYFVKIYILCLFDMNAQKLVAYKEFQVARLKSRKTTGMRFCYKYAPDVPLMANRKKPPALGKGDAKSLSSIDKVLEVSEEYTTKRLAALHRALFFSLTVPQRDDADFVTPMGVSLSTRQNLRDDNQDRSLFVRFAAEDPNDSFVMLALCDGVGGLREGGRCAEIALTLLIAHLISVTAPTLEERASEAVEFANRGLFERYLESGATTLAMVLVSPFEAIALNVGDSRIYCANSSETEIISIEDRLGFRMRAAGLDISDIEPSFANRLSQYIGMGDPVRPHIRRIDPNDPACTIALTSDGAHSWIDEHGLLPFSRTNGINLSRFIVEGSVQADEPDNATAICFEGALIGLLPKTVDRGFFNFLELWSPWRNSTLLYEMKDPRFATGKVETKSDEGDQKLSHEKPINESTLVKGENADPSSNMVEISNSEAVEIPPKKRKRNRLVIEQLKFSDDASSEI